MKRYAIGSLLLLLLVASTSAEHKRNYRFTYISIQRGMFQCYNEQKPEVQELGNLLILACDGE